MKGRPIGAFVAAALGLALPGCRAKPPAHPGDADVAGRVSHVVLCWLKDPGNKDDRARIVAASREFRSIPGVVDVRAGEVVPSGREIVDDSFDVAILLTFANERDMNSYVDHPRHKAAAKDVLMPLVKKVVVYDFVEGGAASDRERREE